MTTHKHYLMPKRFEAKFAQMVGSNGRGIRIEDFAIAVDDQDIKTFPDYDTFNAAWEGSWQAFFDQHANQNITQKQAFDFCTKLIDLFGLKT
jgi:hypothetical protein